MRTGANAVCKTKQLHSYRRATIAKQHEWRRNSPAGIRILSQRCQSWPTQQKDKTLSKPLLGASGSHGCCQKTRKVSLTLPPRRSALGSSISPAKRLIESLRAIGTAQPFTSLPVGWRAQKVILPSRSSNSQLRQRKNQITSSINSTSQHCKFVPKTRKRARTLAIRSSDLSP